MSFFKSPVGLIVTVGVLVLILGTVLFFTTEYTSPGEKPEPLGQQYEEIGKDHIDVGTPHQAYNSNPPTSGPHYAQPAVKRFYDEVLPDEQLIHNLEHGEIWISYKDTSDATKDELRAIQGRNSGSVIVTQRPSNLQNICLASWTRLLCMDVLDAQTAPNFIKANKNLSPEPLAR